MISVQQKHFGFLVFFGLILFLNLSCKTAPDVSENKDSETDFARQVDHFLDGLIVFKVSEEKIWNPESIDRNALKAFYKKDYLNRLKERHNLSFIPKI